MIRSRRLQSWIPSLALAAILLVALAPTVSRWVGSGTQRLPDALAAMCTSSGMSWLKPGGLPDTTQETPAPAGTMPDEYCGYCPLLASVVPLLLVVIVLLATLPSMRLPDGHAPPSGRQPRLRGLGARGPPILL